MILAANFKMNHTRASTKLYLDRLGMVDFKDVEVFVFPPATALQKHECGALIGAQNAYPAEHGSYTGEIGLQQLKEFGIKTLILGHSERRHLMGEHQEFIVKKFDFYKERGFRIFYCIGETSEVRECGSQKFIHAYIDEQLKGIDLEYERLVIAYEPVWAIGTGRNATEEEIVPVLEYLSAKIDAPLLYGGSVKTSNIESILRIPHCDGALIGTASWDVEEFIKMIEIAKEI